MPWPIRPPNCVSRAMEAVADERAKRSGWREYAGGVKIARVDVYAFRYTLAEGPFVMSGGKVATAQDSTIVRLVTDEGLVGWGDQCPITPNYAPAPAAG